jgi:FixJ family two-component response regulator
MPQEYASTIAVVDDDDDVGQVLRGLLETVGYQVETYRSGQQFLDAFKPAQHACLVVDQNMPQMTGLEMLTELDARGATLPTVLITGGEDPDLARQAIELGVMKVLHKPMSARELLRFISFSVG